MQNRPQQREFPKHFDFFLGAERGSSDPHTDSRCHGHPLPGSSGAGPGRSRVRPRPEAERGPGRADRAGWVGDARRSGAPHRPRRLARAPTVPAAAGGGSQATGGGGEADEAVAGAPLAAYSLPGLRRERYCALARGALGPGFSPFRGAGDRERGPKRCRALDWLGAREASAALGPESWGCAALREAGGKRWSPRPPRSSRGQLGGGWSALPIRAGWGNGDRAGESAPGVSGRPDPARSELEGSAPGTRRARSWGADKAGRGRPAARRLGAEERREGSRVMVGRWGTPEGLFPGQGHTSSLPRAIWGLPGCLC